MLTMHAAHPEASTRCSGTTYSALEIGHLVGTDLNPERWSEFKVNIAKYDAARPSRCAYPGRKCLNQTRERV
jgi:hypothetical protein